MWQLLKDLETEISFNPAGGDRRWGARGGIALEEIYNVDDRVMDEANHHGTCIPM